MFIITRSDMVSLSHCANVPIKFIIIRPLAVVVSIFSVHECSSQSLSFSCDTKLFKSIMDRVSLSSLDRKVQMIAIFLFLLLIACLLLHALIWSHFPIVQMYRLNSSSFAHLLLWCLYFPCMSVARNRYRLVAILNYLSQ